MKLEDAIKHAEEKSGSCECGKEHAQLAKWLKELTALRASPTSAPEGWKLPDALEHAPLRPDESAQEQVNMWHYTTGWNAFREAMLAAPTPPVSEDRWQPIETAPKDGSDVLLAGKRREDIASGYWLQSAYAGNGAWIWPFVHKDPTHWMPLPKAPAMQEDKP